MECTVISEKSNLLDWTKSGELIDRFLSFSLNRKPLLTKISAAIEAEATSESFYSRTVQLLSQVDGYLDDLAFSMDCDVVFGGNTISRLLKSAGISLREDYENPLERLLDYMELVQCFEREKLFVFVNLRSFYSDDAVSRFLQSALAHGYRLLLVDSQERPYLPEEQRLVIDKDLCEI